MSDNWTARLSEYLDETLAPAERHALAAHLSGCAFEQRCQWSRPDPCLSAVPPLAAAGDAHRSACPVWLAGEPS